MWGAGPAGAGCLVGVESCADRAVEAGSRRGAYDEAAEVRGAELYIRRRTVEWHLRKVYAELEISSRNQLGRLRLSALESA